MVEGVQVSVIIWIGVHDECQRVAHLDQGVGPPFPLLVEIPVGKHYDDPEAAAARAYPHDPTISPGLRMIYVITDLRLEGSHGADNTAAPRDEAGSLGRHNDSMSSSRNMQK